MKKRALKKYAKARHSYGHSVQGIKMEMNELSHLGKHYLENNLRFWTYKWNKKRKYLKKHPELMENGLGMIISRKEFEEFKKWKESETTGGNNK